MALSFAHGAIQWSTSDALNAIKTVSGLSFEPKALRFWCMGIGSAVDASAATTHFRVSVGFATGTADRRCVAAQDQDAAPSMVCTTGYRADAVIMTLTSTPAADGLLDLNSITSDGFTLIVDDVTPVNLTVFWEAWGGSDITVAQTLEIAEPAATGVQTYSVTGFTASATDQVVMFAGCQATAAAPTAARNDSGICVGFAAGINAADNVVILANNDDASANVAATSYGLAGECLAMIAVPTSTTVQARARLTQWNAGNFGLNWLARGSTGRKSIALAIKGGAWAVKEQTINIQSAGATSTVSGLAFQPIGLCVMSVAAGEHTAGTATSTVGALGAGTASGTTSRRSMNYADLSGASSADVYLSIDYDSVLCSAVSGTSLAVDLDAITSDGFRLIVDDNEATGSSAFWIGSLSFASGGAAAAEFAAAVTLAITATGALSTATLFTGASVLAVTTSSALSTSIALASTVTATVTTTGVLTTGWTPPLGIPSPPFGITESAPAIPDPWTTNTSGFYYVAPGGTNVNEGFPSSPRGTVPTSLPAGAVVIVTAGDYASGSNRTWTSSGTSGSPVFIVGEGSPSFSSTLDAVILAGSYMIVDGLVFDMTQVVFTGNHLAMRSCEIVDFSPASNASACTFSGTPSDVVVYDCHIHDNGDSESATELDIHGIKPDTGVDRLWVVDCHIHHNGGDGIQVGNASSSEPWAQFIYIGRCHIHDDRENAVDLKRCRDVIVSQCDLHGYEPQDSSSGSMMTVHDGATRVWVLNNRIYDGDFAIENSGSQSFYALGNLIYEITSPTHDMSSQFAHGHGILIYSSADVYCVSNTLWDVGAGISTPSGSGAAEFVNNIIGGRNETGSRHFASSTRSGVVFDHNLLEGTPVINWSGTPTNQVNDDPDFANAASDDYSLLATSPAIGVGTEHAAYDTFETLYDLDIRKDSAGRARPQDTWDIGAYEFYDEATPDLFAAGITLVLTTAGALATVIAPATSATATATATGALTTAIQAAGAATLRITTAGALTTVVALVGASTATITASGDLSVTDVFAGTATATVVAAGALTTVIRAAGAASLTATTAGALTTVIATASAVTLRVTTAGSLTNAITAASAATLRITTAGALTTSIPLQSAATATATTAGALTTVLAAQGAASLTLTTVGALTTAVTLAGSVTATVAAQAQMAGTGAALEASLALTGAGSGTLTTAIPLSSAAILSATTSAPLTTELRLAGASAVALAATGALTAGMGFAATATLRVTTTALFTNVIRMAGTASLALTASGTVGVEAALVGSASLTVVTAGDMATALLLASQVAARLDASGALTTEIRLLGSSSVVVLATGDLAVKPGGPGWIGITEDRPRVGAVPIGTRTGTTATRARTGVTKKRGDI